MYCTYWNGIFAWSVFFSDRFGSWKWTNLNCWKTSNCSHSWGFCRGVTQWKRRSWEQWWTMVVKLQERYCTCCSVFIFCPSYPESTIYEYNFGKLTQGFSDIVFYSEFWLGETLRKNWPRHAGKFTTKKFWHSKWDLWLCLQWNEQKLTGTIRMSRVYDEPSWIQQTIVKSFCHRCAKNHQRPAAGPRQPNDAATLAFVDRCARRKLWGLARNKRNKGVSPLFTAAWKHRRNTSPNLQNP